MIQKKSVQAVHRLMTFGSPCLVPPLGLCHCKASHSASIQALPTTPLNICLLNPPGVYSDTSDGV